MCKRIGAIATLRQLELYNDSAMHREGPSYYISRSTRVKSVAGCIKEGMLAGGSSRAVMARR